MYPEIRVHFIKVIIIININVLELHIHYISITFIQCNFIVFAFKGLYYVYLIYRAKMHVSASWNEAKACSLYSHSCLPQQYCFFRCSHCVYSPKDKVILLFHLLPGSGWMAFALLSFAQSLVLIINKCNSQSAG